MGEHFLFSLAFGVWNGKGGRKRWKDLKSDIMVVQEGGKSIFYCCWCFYKQLDLGIPLLGAHVGATSQPTIESLHNCQPP